jgi:hypothetical protein
MNEYAVRWTLAARALALVLALALFVVLHKDEEEET